MAEPNVPTRSSYVVAVVRPEECTFANDATLLVRLGAWAVAPMFAGLLMKGQSLAVPLYVGAGIFAPPAPHAVRPRTCHGARKPRHSTGCWPTTLRAWARARRALRPMHGPLRRAARAAVDRLLDCGLLEHGFARVRCRECRAEFLVAFRCNGRPAAGAVTWPRIAEHPNAMARGRAILHTQSEFKARQRDP